MGLMGEEYREAVGGQASGSAVGRVEQAGIISLTSCSFEGDVHLSTTRPYEMRIDLPEILGAAPGQITDREVSCPLFFKCESCPKRKVSK